MQVAVIKPIVRHLTRHRFDILIPLANDNVKTFTGRHVFNHAIELQVIERQRPCHVRRFQVDNNVWH